LRNHGPFDHSKTRYPLAGKHRGVKCETCHRKARAGLFKVEKFDTCSAPGCHDTKKRGAVHGEQFATRKCEDCHTLGGWKPATFSHDAKTYKGYKLSGAHAKLKCEQCHARDLFGVTRYRPIEYSSCAAPGCHDTKKRGNIHGRQFAARKCEDCHTEKEWKPSTFSHDAKTYKGYKLAGAHAKLKCEKCHKPDFAGRIKYKPIESKTCVGSACHTDPHKSSLKPKKCEDCHNERDWKKLAFDHNRDSAYPLDGKHVKAACEKCHVDKLWKPLAKTCVGCHEKDDKHKNSFGKRCEDCHTAQTWKTDKFVHEVTGFRLDGAHANLTCQMCHTTKNTRLGPGEDCAQCHVDPHFSQFGAFCSDCHDAKSWEPMRFNHNLTGFRLEGAHRSTTCEDCHKNRDYRNTPSQCYACHVTEFFAPAAQGIHSPSNTDCEQCHKIYSWSPAAGHRHQVMTFSGSHAAIQGSCSLCHAGGSGQLLYPGAASEEDCVACHMRDYAREHANGDPPGAPACPQTCSLCHNTVTFDDAREIVRCD